MKYTYKTPLSVAQVNKVLARKARRGPLIKAVMTALRNNQSSVLVYGVSGIRLKLTRSRTSFRNLLLRSFSGSMWEKDGETFISGKFRMSLSAYFILSLWFACVLIAICSYLITIIRAHVAPEPVPLLIPIALLAAGVLFVWLSLKSSRKDEAEVTAFITKELKAVRVETEKIA